MPSMNRPDALEALLGAGNTQEAFARILLETLRDLKESMQGLDRKFDDHSAQHSAKVAAQDAQIADVGRRLEALEDARRSGREQFWKAMGVALPLLSLVVTVLMSLRAHH